MFNLFKKKKKFITISEDHNHNLTENQVALLLWLVLSFDERKFRDFTEESGDTDFHIYMYNRTTPIDIRFYYKGSQFFRAVGGIDSQKAAITRFIQSSDNIHSDNPALFFELIKRYKDKIEFEQSEKLRQLKAKCDAYNARLIEVGNAYL